jgi:hypothetical protein
MTASDKGVLLNAYLLAANGVDIVRGSLPGVRMGYCPSPGIVELAGVCTSVSEDATTIDLRMDDGRELTGLPLKSCFVCEF